MPAFGTVTFVSVGLLAWLDPGRFPGKRAEQRRPKSPFGPSVGEEALWGALIVAPSGSNVGSNIGSLIASDMSNSFEEKFKRAQSFDVFEALEAFDGAPVVPVVPSGKSTVTGCPSRRRFSGSGTDTFTS